MKTTNWNKLIAPVILSLGLSACSFLNPGALPKALVGEQPNELRAKVNELMELAGTDSVKAELASVNTTFIYNPNGGSATVHLHMIDPEDKNKMKEYAWRDTDGRRNLKEINELVVSTWPDNDIVDTYEGYKDMLFSYEDIRMYLDNLPVYCKEALEASGYKDKGYVSSFSFDKRTGALIYVTHKEKSTLSKWYKIAPDGKHIIIPD